MDCTARRDLEHHLRSRDKVHPSSSVIVTCRRLLRHIHTIKVAPSPVHASPGN